MDLTYMTHRTLGGIVADLKRPRLPLGRRSFGTERAGSQS